MKLLAADIGGTKTILRLVEVKREEKSFETIEQETYPSKNFPDLVPMVQQFLTAINQPPPEVACLAIAGPVINNTCKLTNISWYIDRDRLQKELDIEKVSLINDFAAVSYGVLGLEESELETLQAGNPVKNTPIGVIGAGTGLGEGFLVPQGSDYQVFASEGGHSDFAPRSELECQLLQYVKDKQNLDRVSVERVVSGQGIVAIYQFLRDRSPTSESKDVGDKIRQWEQQVEKQQEKTIDPAATISQAALEKNDPLCTQTMEMFVEAYGAEAGNLALKLLSYGGIYIAGGIAAKNLSLMRGDRFISAFKQKGRMSDLLEKMPVRVVLNQQVGLIGSILYGLKQS